MLLEIKTTEDELRLRCIAELELQEQIGGSFRQFVQTVAPNYIWHRHNIVLADALERVAKGEIKRLMVFEPPRHGKSEEVSRLFPAYLLYKYPGIEIGLVSYAAELATGLSKDARKNYLYSGKKINIDISAAREWHTLNEGRMWATGIGGPITGRGYNFGIIDDPLKNAEEAQSEQLRKKQLEWYDSTFYTRREPDAAIILIQTRWHEDDLAGRLLQREKQQPHHWHIVNFEAIKESAERKFPPTCTVEPDWREPGEALCPELFPLKNLLETRRSIGARFFSALYQQRPSIEEGNMWKRDWFNSIEYQDLPDDLQNDGCDWDLAYTEKEINSASAFIRSAVDSKGNMYVLDLGYKWLEFPELIDWIKKQQAPHYIEAKASGKSAKQTLTRENIAALEIEIEGGDKIARALLASPPVENGKVFILSHLFEKLLDDEKQGILKFPNGIFNDLNDVFVQALNRQFKGGLMTLSDARSVVIEEMEAISITDNY